MNALWFILGCIALAALIVASSNGVFGPKVKKSVDEVRRWWSY